MRDNVFCEKSFESSQISLLRGTEKSFQKAPLLV